MHRAAHLKSHCAKKLPPPPPSLSSTELLSKRQPPVLSFFSLICLLCYFLCYFFLQPPPPPPTLCADSYNYATLCRTPIDDATCQALGCSDNGYTCAAADCGDGTGCTTRCITQGWYFPGVPMTPISYTCPRDGTVAEPCSFDPLPGQATCDDLTCDGGMMCGDYSCSGTCGPMCVPLPPPQMFPWMGVGQIGGGGGDSPCPNGGPMMLCKVDACATTCPKGQTCHTSPCNCTAVCFDDKKYKGPVSLGKGRDGRTAGSNKLKGLKTHKCVQGEAVEPKTCKDDPCDAKQCNEKTHTCVRE
jgi:hypothetical protein